MKKVLKNQAARKQTASFQIRPQRSASLFFKNAIHDYRAWQPHTLMHTEEEKEKISNKLEKSTGLYNYRVFKRTGRAYGKTPTPQRICLIVGRTRGVNQRFNVARTTSRRLTKHGFLSGQRKSSW